MLYRDNEILIFDEPTAVLTPQEIEELINYLFEEVEEIPNRSERVEELEEERNTLEKSGKNSKTSRTSSRKSSNITLWTTTAPKSLRSLAKSYFITASLICMFGALLIMAQVGAMF